MHGVLTRSAGFLVRAMGMVGISKGQVIRRCGGSTTKRPASPARSDPPWPARRPSYRLRPSRRHEDHRVRGAKCRLAALALHCQTRQRSMARPSGASSPPFSPPALPSSMPPELDGRWSQLRPKLPAGLTRPRPICRLYITLPPSIGLSCTRSTSPVEDLSAADPGGQHLPKQGRHRAPPRSDHKQLV